MLARMKRYSGWILIIAIAAAVALSIGFTRARQIPAPILASTTTSNDSSASTDDRFVVLVDWGNEAVFDRKTGLVWERTANMGFGNWMAAQKRCESLSLGKHEGWRLPTIFELATLVDPNVPSPGPTLTAGHLFKVAPSFYWSATTDLTNSANAWGIGFNVGDVGSGLKSSVNFVWCVRDGDGVEMTPL